MPTRSYYGNTLITPITAVLLVIMIIILLKGNKKIILLPFLLVSCFIPSSQRIVLFGIDLPFIRILVIMGIIRILLKKEYLTFEMQKIDKHVIWYTVIAVLAFSIRTHNSSSIIYIVGWALDVVGFYFVARILACDIDSVINSIVFLAFLSIPISLSLYYERTHGTNLFYYIGGVPLFSTIREGEVRARGAFSHPIIAGAFWAICLPLFIGTRKFTKHKIIMLIAVVACFISIMSCGSSTPIMSLLAGILVLLFYKFRKKLGNVKGLFLIGMVLLQLSMEQPLWFLFTKIDLTGGSTGRFRYILIDQFVRRTPEWLLFGVDSTYHWGAGIALGGVGLADVCIQYVLEGVNGGIGQFIFFIVIIIDAYFSLEHLIYDTNNKKYIFFSWCLLSALFVHLFNFLGVSYFGQITTFWWYTLAIITNVHIQLYKKEDNRNKKLEEK